MNRTALFVALLLVGCGRQALLEAQEVIERPALMSRLSFELRPANAVVFNQVLPTRLEATLVGELPATERQRGFVAARQLGSETAPVDVEPRGTGLQLARLTVTAAVAGDTRVSVTLQDIALVWGTPTAVAGSLLVTQGDVASAQSFTGTLTLRDEPGGASVSLRAEPTLRPFDALKVCVEQPMADTDMVNLRVLVGGVPSTFRVLSGSGFATCHQLGLDAFPLPGAELGLGGFLRRSGRDMKVPFAPQARLAGWMGDWSEEPTTTAPTPIEPAPVQPSRVASRGASLWRQLMVPDGARTLHLWLQPFASQSRGRSRPAQVRLFARPGEPTVLAEASPSRACTRGEASFCGDWQERTFDVTAFRGRTVWLEIGSNADSFFEPVSDGFGVGPFRFDTR